MLLPIAAEHPASEIVCEDENYIWVVGHNNDTKRLKVTSLLGVIRAGKHVACRDARIGYLHVDYPKRFDLSGSRLS